MTRNRSCISSISEIICKIYTLNSTLKLA